MPPKKNIEIASLGEAVTYQQAIVIFFDKHYKWFFRLFITTILSGLAIGIRSCSMTETVNVKEFLPTGSIDYPFTLTAQTKSKQSELFKMDEIGIMYGWGQPIGKSDPNYSFYKIEGQETIVIVDRKKNKIHLMDTPEVIRK